MVNISAKHDFFELNLSIIFPKLKKNKS
jgi:hypothetical protein